MSARDLVETIHSALCANGLDSVEPSDAVLVVRALRSAGYRILGPGELDSETIEVAAKVAEEVALMTPLTPGAADGASIAVRQIAAVIRALGGGDG